jgi:hypothetical protein
MSEETKKRNFRRSRFQLDKPGQCKAISFSKSQFLISILIRYFLFISDFFNEIKIAGIGFAEDDIKL